MHTDATMMLKPLQLKGALPERNSAETTTQPISKGECEMKN